MKKYKKISYKMKAEKVHEGTKIYNFLEGCRYETTKEKCIRLIGTAGEEWPVSIEKLMKTYQFANGEKITSENIPDGVFEISTIVDDTAEAVYAFQTKMHRKVITSWGEILTANRPGINHGEGDFIILACKDGKPNPDDQWVVNGQVFLNTYAPVE